jgi:membrane fusion protein, multidrug efflux system
MYKKIYIPAICLAITIMATSCNKKKQENGSSKRNIRVEGFIVSRTTLEQTISLSGTIKSFEETVLMPEVSGRVVSVNLPEGKLVKQGTLLVKIYDDDLQAQLKKANVELLIAEQTLQRQTELLKVNGTSQADFDQANLQVNSIRADIELIHAQIKKTEVHAPYDGIIGLRNISLGAQVSPTTALAVIRKSDKLKIDFGVPERYSSYIRPGMKIEFTLQSEETHYKATVFASEEGIDASTRNLKTRALIESYSTSIIPGAYANIELHLSENQSALLVPTQAIIPQENKKQLIVASNGKVKFVNVTTGTRTTSRVEVLTGLQPGDTIITTGILFLKANDVLRFTKVQKDSL